ncbi:VOC family protein [Streptomyces sp. NPDC048564]|uniref:VOC family protein n=1 Tax=Streptomyces sp. NPDC048564 TaxID=3155760 RepID=UPI00342C1ECC
MDYKLEVVTLSVNDVDQAAAFYTRQAGFTLDVDYHPAGNFPDENEVDRGSLGPP